MNLYDRPAIEVCSNNEWVWANVLNLHPECPFRDKAADEWHADVCRQIDGSGLGISVSPRGQRITCHGWNGANTFARKGRGLGSFHHFTDDEWDRLEQIASDVADDVSAKYTMQEIMAEIECLDGLDDDDFAKAFDHITDWHGLPFDDELLANYVARRKALLDE